MSNNRFSGLEAFVAVAEAGSITAGARRLGRSKAVVSRQVRRLEERLSTQLLHRTTRSLSLTDAGAALYERAAAAIEDLDEAEAAISSLHGLVRGRLRVTLPTAYGRKISAPVLVALASEHPDLELDLTFTDRYVDLVGEGFDLAVRIGHLADSSLIARRLGETRQIVCAAPSYFASRSRPAQPSDLTDHDCLIYAGQVPGPAWRFADGETVAVRGRIRSDYGDALFDAAVAGFGIAQLPDFYFGNALESGLLESLLTDFEAEPLGVWAVYPPRRHLSLKVRAAVDRLAEAVGAREVGAPWRTVAATLH
jgi:DNA-binding transcriptional LysR family regulator